MNRANLKKIYIFTQYHPNHEERLPKAQIRPN